LHGQVLWLEYASNSMQHDHNIDMYDQVNMITATTCKKALIVDDISLALSNCVTKEQEK